mmetsp:Transcript_4901/g.10517  ORF Transcript_4901/g.10517 Transcript_4901/m.10517 type:complete len:87 (-) Transcript_4901:203-463(-)
MIILTVRQFMWHMYECTGHSLPCKTMLVCMQVPWITIDSVSGGFAPAAAHPHPVSHPHVWSGVGDHHTLGQVHVLLEYGKYISPRR